MAEISKITLPSGNTYDIKDAVAREMISGGVQFIIAWNGTSTPVIADIPAGVKVTYQDTEYTGTLSAENAQPGAFYLVSSSTQTPGSLNDVYDEYVPVGTTGSKTWEKIGDTQVDLSDVIKSVQVGEDLYFPDESGGVDITGSLNVWLSNKVTNAYILDGSTEESVSLKKLQLQNGSPVPGDPVTPAMLRTALMSIYGILVVRMGIGGYEVYKLTSMFTEENAEYFLFVHYQPGNDEALQASLSAVSDSSPLTGSISHITVISNVTLNKQTDVVLGEATTFSLTSGSVTHGALTGHTKNALGANATFTGSVTPSLNTTVRYLSASASGGSVSASGDAVTVVTGYASPTTDTFVKSVTAETNKNLVTTTVPNVTGNTSVSIPNVTANTKVNIPNVTSVGTASSWSFTMGSGANSETLVIGGANGTTPTLGQPLAATNTTLGTNLSASKVTLGNAITVATGETSTTGTGDAVVTGVTIGSSASALTSLGTASTDTVLGTASTFAVTEPTITLTANTTGITGGVQYLQAANGKNTTVSVSVNSADTVTAVTSMPTSTVGTSITVGTNDKVTALTNDTTITAL